MGDVKDRGKPRVEVTREPPIYGDGRTHNMYADLIRAQAGDTTSETRHLGHTRYVRERRTNPNTSNGSGGFFTQTYWDEPGTVLFPRNPRVIADQVVNLPLTVPGASRTVPTLTAGTSTAVQQPGSAVADSDLTDSTIVTSTVTIAGQTAVSLQWLEQGPDTQHIVSSDLLSDYNQKLETQLLTGTGSNNQLLGLLTNAATNSVTYTAATPTAIGMWPSLGQLIAKTAQKSGTAAGGFYALSSSRAAWLTSSEDSSLRPLMLTNAPPNGAVDINGYRTLLTDAMPRNLGAATNEERIVFFVPSMCVLWESEPTVSVAVETLSATLGAVVTFRRYVQFVCRVPASVSILTGSGCIPVSPF